MSEYVPGVYTALLGNSLIPLKHLPDRIAEAVFSIAGMGRIEQSLAGNGYTNGNHNGQGPVGALPHAPFDFRREPDMHFLS